ncbi:hypothetical protein OIV19_21540 [Brucella sp. HL-2]|nr:hypothetical protein [Brucella sp. HL-2]MCV9910182.1 hypothetical protein [Brucella sp. HL-2]
MPVKLSNNAASLLAGNISATDTTLSVQPGDAGKFPTLLAEEWFPLTLVDGSGNMEIVRVTTRNGAIMTIQRAQEGTSALAFVAGSRVDLRATAGALNELGDRTTTVSVGAAVAGANSKQAPADGDFFTGVGAGGSTMFKTTWGNIKAALAAIFYNKTEVNNIVAGTMNGRAYPRRSDGAAVQFQWSGQSGQPSWLWGGNGDGTAYQVWDPKNFSVNYANSTWNAERLQGWDIPSIQNDAQARANGAKNEVWWRARDYLLGEDFPVGTVAMCKIRNSTTFTYGQNVGGVDLVISNAGSLNGAQVNYGTWRVVSSSVGGSTAGLVKRIG